MIWPSLLAFLGACANAGDLPDVYRKTVVHEEKEPTPDWKEGRLEKEKLPRYPRKAPRVGDFTLYWIERTYDGQDKDEQVAAYLLLDYVKEVRENRWAGAAGRVYGLSRDRWGGLVHKGLTRLPSSRARHCAHAEPWPDESLGSFDGATLSVENLTYFRDYEAFAASRNYEVTRVAFQTPAPGRRLFGVGYRTTDFPSVGDEWLLLCDRVPVRGLLRGRQSWSSSSGLHNHVERITLLHHGRLGPAELKTLEEADDVLPSERALWEALRVTK